LREAGIVTATPFFAAGQQDRGPGGETQGREPRGGM